MVLKTPKVEESAKADILESRRRGFHYLSPKDYTEINCYQQHNSREKLGFSRVIFYT